MEFFDAFDNIGWIRIFIKLVQLENNDRQKVTVRLADSITGSTWFLFHFIRNSPNYLMTTFHGNGWILSNVFAIFDQKKHSNSKRVNNKVSRAPVIRLNHTRLTSSTSTKLLQTNLPCVRLFNCFVYVSVSRTCQSNILEFFDAFFFSITPIRLCGCCCFGSCASE